MYSIDEDVKEALEVPGSYDTDLSSHSRYSLSIYREDVRKRYETVEYFGGIDKMRPWEGFHGGYYLWDLFPPSFNCPFRERLGKFSEGGKVICNWQALDNLGKLCNIFSFGVRDDISFEIEMAKRTKCNIFAFDPSVPHLPVSLGDNIQEYQPCSNGGKIVFESVGLGGAKNTEKSSDMPSSWEIHTLQELMIKKSVKTIDLLKIDIEGNEWEVFEQLADSGTLNMVNQLSIELHFKQQVSNEAGINSGVRDVFHLFETCERAGLYPFSWEVNFNPSGFSDMRPWAIEYSFVRADSPFMKTLPYGHSMQECFLK